jgi:hypothetical protein
VAEAALSALAALSGRTLSRGAFHFKSPPTPLQGAALNSEIARAREWAAVNAQALTPRK